MSKPIPTVQKYMTYMPHTIGFDQSLAKAAEMMAQYHVRHLPVLKGGKLVGILSDRDLKLVTGFRDVDPKKALVDEAYTPDPYMTEPGAPLNDVAAEMAEKKFGCALVVDNNKLVGIFTEVDALKALSELLQTRLRS